MLTWTFIATASAADVVLKNDTVSGDVFGITDFVGWMDPNECAISVLSPDTYPVVIDELQVLFTATNEGLAGTEGGAEVHFQVRTDGTPTVGAVDWGPMFYIFEFSIDALTSLDLNVPDKGLGPIRLDEGEELIAWIRPADPASGYGWPGSTTIGEDVTGVMIQGLGPSAGSYLYDEGVILDDFTGLGAGAWVVRGLGSDTIAPKDTGDPKDSGDSGDSGNPGFLDDTGDTIDPGALALTSINPTSTAAGVPVDVALIGGGFDDDTTVSIGGLNASVVSRDSDSAMVVRSPSALPAGVHDVSVSRGSDTELLPGAFEVVAVENALPEPAEEGCGCAATGEARGGSWLAAVLGLVGVLRRRDQRG